MSRCDVPWSINAHAFLPALTALAESLKVMPALVSASTKLASTRGSAYAGTAGLSANATPSRAASRLTTSPLPRPAAAIANHQVVQPQAVQRRAADVGDNRHWRRSR